MQRTISCSSPDVSIMCFEYCICRATARHEAKLHVINRYPYPDDFSNYSFNSFHDMVKEFERSEVTSGSSGQFPFPFVNVGDEAVLPVRWRVSISYHGISKVSNQPCASIAGGFQHFSNYPSRTSSFPTFHLLDCFQHHFNSYEDGRAYNRASN